LAKGATDADGRINDLLDASHEPETGSYRLTFDTDSYFSSHGVKSIFPMVVVVFEVSDPSQHYHIPLLVSPFGYSTYRGS
jgi:5-hydroxyisourate hydrolase